MSANPTADVTPIAYTIFADRFAKRKDELAEPWAQIVQRIKSPKVAAEKKALPLISMGVYGDVRSDKGALRHQANLRAITGVEGDYDGEVVPMEGAAAHLTFAGIRAVLYTSPSHTPDKPRWRVLAPLSREYPPSERTRFLARLNGILGGLLTGESFTISQSFYVGRVEGREYEVIDLTGDCIDERDEFDASAALPKGKQNTANGGLADDTLDEDLRAAIRTGGNFHEPLRGLAARLIGRGGEPDDVIAVLQGLMQQSEQKGTDRWRVRWEEIPGLVESAAAKFRDPRRATEVEPPPDDGRFAPIETVVDDGTDVHPAVLLEADGASRTDTRGRGDDSTTARLKATWSENYGTIKATPCVVGNLIESGSLVLIYGESNTGKSTFAIDLAMTCGRGIPWRGRRTRKAVAIYLPLEGTQGVRHRVQAKLRRDETPEPVPFADLTGHINLLDDTCVVILIAALRELHARDPKAELLLIVDTVARAMVGGDENSSQDMGKLIGACDALRAELGCTVLLIHHAGKDTSKGARGHSSLRAAVDTELEVTGTVNPRVVTVRKQRDLPSGEMFAFDLEAVELGTVPETFDRITACVVVHRDETPTMHKQAAGKNQRELLAAIRGWQSNGQEIITRHELHELAKGLGGAFKRWDRRDAAITGLEERQLLTPTVGGFHVSP